MYAVSDTFVQALRSSHAITTRLDAYLGGTLIKGDIAITGGSVQVGSGTGVRRTLTCTIADDKLWSTLNVLGVELRAYRGIRFPNGGVEEVPLGAFLLDQQQISFAPGGGLQVSSAPDRWAKVARAQFELPASSVRGNTIVQEIVRLVTAAVTPDSTSVQTSDTTQVTQLTWDRDRAAAVNDLAESIGAEVFFGVDGGLIVRPVPTLSQTPAWTVDASPTGVMLGGDATRDRSRTYNVVVATMAAVDGRTPFAPQIAADTAAGSPTNVTGPFGRVPYFYSSASFRTAAQALTAAKAKLLQVKAMNAQVGVSSIVNPALDRGDVINILTPDGRRELHQVDTVTIPLEVGGTQNITTVSAWPDGDIPAGG